MRAYYKLDLRPQCYKVHEMGRVGVQLKGIRTKNGNVICFMRWSGERDWLLGRLRLAAGDNFDVGGMS